MIRTLAAAALAAGTLATGAHAAPVGPVCRQVAQNGNNVVAVCVFADPHNSRAIGTVAPEIGVGCAIGASPTCALLFADPTIQIGTTGFTRNVSYPVPTVDPATGTVHVYAGTLGTLWVNGTGYPIGTDDYCIGDPTIC